MDLILPLNALNPCPSEIYRHMYRRKSPPLPRLERDADRSSLSFFFLLYSASLCREAS